jgi:4-amino-4-deoxy-L-arabinose transferase-like glycosyltransferase
LEQGVRQRQRGLVAAAIFLVSLGLSIWLQAWHIEFTSDEGIMLEAAQRLLRRQSLYRDFFGYMSPGSYWIQEACFRVLGVTQLAARLPVLVDVSLSAALVYWIACWISGARLAAGIAALLYWVFETATPGMLTAQHRWDSAALSLAAIAAALRASESASRKLWAMAGALLAAAALCTPTIGLLLGVTLVWMLAVPALRSESVFFLAGSGGVGLAAVVAMASSGILAPFLQQMQWLQRNYSAVNAMPYGAIIGGYGSLFQGVDWAAMPIAVLLVVCLAAGAIVPLTALLGWAGALRFAKSLPKPAHVLLWLAGLTAAYVATAFPRADVMHLGFVAALPAAMTAAWIARYAPRPARLAVSVVLGFGAAMFCWQIAQDRSGTDMVRTSVGDLWGNPREIAAMKNVASRVRSADTLFVHPYMPVFYFLTQARNPTRFSYLSPGMMTDREAAMALEDLNRDPPRWILHLDLGHAEFMRIFPYAQGMNHKFPAVEQWIAERYRPVEGGAAPAGYRLLEPVGR